jgi:hypothetical protein
LGLGERFEMRCERAPAEFVGKRLATRGVRVDDSDDVGIWERGGGAPVDDPAPTGPDDGYPHGDIPLATLEDCGGRPRGTIGLAERLVKQVGGR